MTMNSWICNNQQNCVRIECALSGIGDNDDGNISFRLFNTFKYFYILEEILVLVISNIILFIFILFLYLLVIISFLIRVYFYFYFIFIYLFIIELIL